MLIIFNTEFWEGILLPQLPVHAAKLLNGGMPSINWVPYYEMGAAPFLFLAWTPRFFQSLFQLTLSKSSLTSRQILMIWVAFVFIQTFLWCG